MPKNERVVFLQRVLILLMSNAFIYIGNSAYGPFLGAYYTQKGIPVGQIGILLAVGPVAAVLIQPVWAGISDKTGRRKRTLMIVVAGTALSILTYYLGSGFFSYFAATLLLMSFSTSLGPLCDTVVVHESRRMHLNFAHVRLGGTIGYAVNVLFMGVVFRYWPGAIFACASGLYALMFLFVSRLPPDPDVPRVAAPAAPPEEESAPAPKRKARGLSLFTIFENREIVFVLLFALSIQIGLSFYGSFLGVYLQTLGEDSYIGVANMISAISEVPVLLLIDRIRRKLGTFPILFSCGLLMGLRLLLITSGSLGFVFAIQALQGVTYIPVYFCCVMYICENVFPGKQSQGQSFLAITQAGIGSIVGNICGGQLVDLLGIQSAYRSVGVVTIALTAVSLLLYVSLRKSRFIAR